VYPDIGPQRYYKSQDWIERRVKPIPKECKALPAKVPESNENPASEVEISGALEARPLAPKSVYPAVL
jgi:hypothetical protein